MSKIKVKNVQGRQLWDLAGHPAFEIEITLRFGAQGRAIATSPIFADLQPSETTETIGFINNDLQKALKGKKAPDQSDLDQVLIELIDNNPTLRALPGIVTAVSTAILHAASDTERLPLWQYLGTFRGESSADRLPLPSVEIYSNDGRTSKNLNARAFSIIPMGASSFFEALNWCHAVSNKARNAFTENPLLSEMGEISPLQSDEHALEVLTQAIGNAGFQPGIDIGIALDMGASNFGENGAYQLIGEDKTLSSDALSGRLADWVTNYPVISIEEPFTKEDLEGYTRLTWAVGKRAQVIANPEIATNPASLQKAIAQTAGNAVSIDISKAQTISDVQVMIKDAKNNGYGGMISTRSGTTEQTTAMHLCVGLGINQIKLGSSAHPQSLTNCNEGMRIAEAISRYSNGALPVDGNLPPRSTFPWT